MEITVDRYDKTFTRTIGKMHVDGQFQCYTAEDAVRLGPKVPGETAIPVGRYRVVISFSNRFQKDLPLLLSVPEFEGVRIHSGNSAADTRGCILVGAGRLVDTVSSSRLAMGNLLHRIEQAIARGEEVWITVS